MTLDEFIVQHDSVAYCEIVISPFGDIEYAIPGHVYKLIDITKESQDELNKIMPNCAAPLNWLCEHTKYAVCWYNYFILPKDYTNIQVSIIKTLSDTGIMSNDINGIITMEKSLCESLEKFEETGDEKYLNHDFSPKPFII